MPPINFVLNQDGTVFIKTSEGIQALPRQQAIDAIAYKGATPLNLEQAQQYQNYLDLKKEHGDSPISAGAAGLARGLTFGLSDVALTKIFGVEPKTLAALKEFNPGASGLGDVAGTLASFAIPGAPLARIGRGAEALLASKLARAAAAPGATIIPKVAGISTSIPGRGVVSTAGEGISRVISPSLSLGEKILLSRPGQVAVKGGAEGLALGLGHGVSAATLADASADKAADILLTEGVKGVALGTGLSLAAAGLASVARKGLNILTKRGRELKEATEVNNILARGVETEQSLNLPLLKKNVEEIQSLTSLGKEIINEAKKVSSSPKVSEALQGQMQLNNRLNTLARENLEMTSALQNMRAAGEIPGSVKETLTRALNSNKKEIFDIRNTKLPEVNDLVKNLRRGAKDEAEKEASNIVGLFNNRIKELKLQNESITEGIKDVATKYKLSSDEVAKLTRVVEQGGPASVISNLIGDKVGKSLGVAILGGVGGAAFGGVGGAVAGSLLGATLSKSISPFLTRASEVLLGIAESGATSKLISVGKGAGLLGKSSLYETISYDEYSMIRKQLQDATPTDDYSQKVQDTLNPYFAQPSPSAQGLMKASSAVRAVSRPDITIANIGKAGKLSSFDYKILKYLYPSETKQMEDNLSKLLKNYDISKISSGARQNLSIILPNYGISAKPQFLQKLMNTSISGPDFRGKRDIQSTTITQRLSSGIK